MDPFTQYAMAVAAMAMDQAAFNQDKIDKERFGVIFRQRYRWYGY